MKTLKLDATLEADLMMILENVVWSYVYPPEDCLAFAPPSYQVDSAIKMLKALGADLTLLLERFKEIDEYIEYDEEYKTVARLIG